MKEVDKADLKLAKAIVRRAGCKFGVRKDLVTEMVSFVPIKDDESGDPVDYTGDWKAALQASAAALNGRSV